MSLDPRPEQLKTVYEKTRLAGEKLDKYQDTSAAERSQFFEKLALLNGGAIVLSVTFLGYFLSAHGALRWRHLLHGSWGSLLVSLFACLVRNFFYQNYVYYVRALPYLRRLADQSEAEAEFAADPTSPLLSEDNTPMATDERQDFAKQLKSRAQSNRDSIAASVGKRKRAERIWRISESVALGAFFSGLTTLVVFAIINT